jgi:ATP-dependent DNA ligase
MRLLRILEPFDHPDFIFEPKKMDGFRALAPIRDITARSCHVMATCSKTWPQLAEEIAHPVRAKNAVLDGEICCLEPDGRSECERTLRESSVNARTARIRQMDAARRG